MDQEVSIDVEADTFFAYNNLISECRDLFIRQMDSSSTGLQGVVMNLNNKITEFLPAVAIHFVSYCEYNERMNARYFIHSLIIIMCQSIFANDSYLY